jgi:hypothetical protein
MESAQEAIREALDVLPRWHVVHWGNPGSSTLLCLWVAGRETLIPIDGDVATVRGNPHSILDGGLIDLLRGVERTQDDAVLKTPQARAARRRLVEKWSSDLSTGAMGVWAFPRGGFVRWIHNSVLHVETGDMNDPDEPLSQGLVDVLVDLGWNPPDKTNRNCWVQPPPEAIETTADLAVLTPMAAFGFDAPPAYE